MADVEMTGCWEKALAQIEGHTLDTETFMRSIRDYTHKATGEILRLEFPLPNHVPSPVPMQVRSCHHPGEGVQM